MLLLLWSSYVCCKCTFSSDCKQQTVWSMSPVNINHWNCLISLILTTAQQQWSSVLYIQTQLCFHCHRLYEAVLCLNWRQWHWQDTVEVWHQNMAFVVCLLIAGTSDNFIVEVLCKLTFFLIDWYSWFTYILFVVWSDRVRRRCR